MFDGGLQIKSRLRKCFTHDVVAYGRGEEKAKDQLAADLTDASGFLPEAQIQPFLCSKIRTS